jgi:hypothetical protein
MWLKNETKNIMETKKELKILLWIVVVFVAAFFLPV